MATIDDNTRLIPNTEKVVEFLLKYGNQKFCLSAIDPDGAIETVTFGRGQEKEMGSWIDKYQDKRNLYYQVNLVRGWLNNKPKKEENEFCDGLHTDIDLPGRESRDKERANALNKLHDYKMPPTIIVDSGNGYQARWRF